jgi:transcriptional regulator with XRE-family HTH domain
VSIGLRIEECRNSLRLRREQLAELVGVEPRQIANYELYEAWPEPEPMSKLASALHIELRDLFDFSDTRFIPRLTLEERLANRKSRTRKSRSQSKKNPAGIDFNR